MEEMNVQNLIVFMKLWENVLVQKAVLEKALSKMKPALAGPENKKPELCTLMKLWENALAHKLLSLKPVPGVENGIALAGNDTKEPEVWFC